SPRSPPRRGLQRRDEVEESFDEGALASTGGAGNDEHRLQGETLRVAQDRHPLARIPVAPRSLKAAASRPRGSCLTFKPLRAMVEELDELRALALGEAGDGLRLADAALVEEPRRLHAPELRDGHQHVEDLRRGDELGRVEKNRLDVLPSRFQVPLPLCATVSPVVL